MTVEFNKEVFRGVYAPGEIEGGHRKIGIYNEAEKWQRPFNYLSRELFPKDGLLPKEGLPGLPSLALLNQAFDGEACRALAGDLGIGLATEEDGRQVNYHGRITPGISGDKRTEPGYMFSVTTEIKGATHYPVKLLYFPDKQTALCYYDKLVAPDRHPSQEQMMKALVNLRARLDANLRLNDLEKERLQAVGIIEDTFTKKDQRNWPAELIEKLITGTMISYGQAATFSDDSSQSKKNKERIRKVDVLCQQKESVVSWGMATVKNMAFKAKNIGQDQIIRNYWNYSASDIACLTDFFQGNEQAFALLIERCGMRYFERLEGLGEGINPEQVFGLDLACVEEILNAGGDALEGLREKFARAYANLLLKIEDVPAKPGWVESVNSLKESRRD